MDSKKEEKQQQQQQEKQEQIKKSIEKSKENSEKFKTPPMKFISMEQNVMSQKSRSEVIPIKTLIEESKKNLKSSEQQKQQQPLSKAIIFKSPTEKKLLSLKSSLESPPPPPTASTKEQPLPSSQQKDDDLETLSSEISLGFGDLLNDLDDFTLPLVIQDGPELYTKILYDIAAYAFRCSHGKLAVQKLKNHSNGYWLPFGPVNDNEKYSNVIKLIYETFLNETLKNLKKFDSATQYKDALNEKSTIKSKKNDELDDDEEIEDNITKTNDNNDDDWDEWKNILENIQLYNIYRFQIPDGQFISRYIFLAQWIDTKKLKCCQDSENICWIPLKDFVQKSKNHSEKSSSSNKSISSTSPPPLILQKLWGNEILSVASILYQQHLGKIKKFLQPNILEFTKNEVMKYFNKNINQQQPTTKLRNYSSTTTTSLRRTTKSNQQMLQLLQDVNFLEKDILKIYCDYIQHCFPAMNMTYCAFEEYFLKCNLLQGDDMHLKNIFRSLCHKNKNFMLYNEFLIGLAALDPNVPDCPLRFSYIFRYYDLDCDNFLTEMDFKKIIKDIRFESGLPLTEDLIEKDFQKRISILKNLFNDKKLLSIDTFIMECVKDSIAMKGIGKLFRAEKPIMDTIHNRQLYEYILNKTGQPFAPKLISSCVRCLPKQYSLAYHAVRLNSSGRIDESKPLMNFQCGEIDLELQFKKKTNKLTLRHSIEIVFNENSTAQKVLSIVRNMMDLNKFTRERKNEIQQFVTNNLTIDLIIRLCKEIKEIFLIEPPVLKLQTPCIVLGDIHGNINDLLTYERQLWPLAPTSNAPNLLFLGDYVDRGDYSIEVVCYLFAMKILSPTKFFLLRGNHEIRSIQRNFTFARECMLKYFFQDGQRVFEEFNNVFDLMPLVGIIDESIFCAHGGIPFSTTKIEDLYKIPMPLPDPENQSKAAWEILWSDPVTDEEYNQVCLFKNQTNETGFTGNLRRSTAYYFTEKALRIFLQTNNLSHVIRAHELELEGYRFHHSGLLITVFSSSRYCNTNNKSAAVFVNSRETEGFLKVIALET